MQALERMKEHTNDKDILDLIEDLQTKIEMLPQQIEEKRLLNKRARGNFKK